MTECNRWVRRTIAVVAVGCLANATQAVPAMTSDGVGQSKLARKGGVNGPILSTYIGQRTPLFELGLRGATRTILSEIDRATASRRGSRIVFTRPVNSFQDAIFLADRNGNVLRRIPTPQVEVTAGMTLSPDRRTLVFTGTEYSPRYPYERYGIFSVDIDGSDFKLLHEDDFATGTGSSSPRFSPDGRLIAYTRPGPLDERRDVVDNPNVWIMRADGSNQRPVLNHRADGESQPFFSPDGKRLAYVRSTAVFDEKSGKVQGHLHSIETTTLRGRHRRRVTGRTNDALFAPVFAPNGRRIAYTRVRAIHTIRLDGRRDRTVPGQRTGRHEYWPLLWLRR